MSCLWLQEKYLSEPYSEDYDPDGTLRLLAFGEDYDQCLERVDCSSSSVSSNSSAGLGKGQRSKRRPLLVSGRPLRKNAILNFDHFRPKMSTN
jgi:hypothetical protein